MENLLESEKLITDSRVLDICKNCIATARDLGLLYPYTGDDIEFTENSALHTFGSMKLPKNPKDGEFQLQLSSHMFNEPKEAIESTVYHELCHYVQNKQQIDEGVITYSPSRAHYIIDFRKCDHNTERAHGLRWKRIAARFSKALGIKISRTNNYSTHKEVGKAYEEGIKYVIRCQKCGAEFRYHKRTDFVRTVQSGINNSGWHCRCGSKQFELIKGPKDE